MNKKMGGRFFVIPEGVPNILIELSPNAERIYSTMRWFFNIREDWESDKEWCVGTVYKDAKTAKKEDVIRQIKGVSRFTFYHGAWKELLKSGLVKEEEGKIILTKYKKKLDSSKPKEFESDFAEDDNNGVTKPESNDRLDKIEGTLEQLTKSMALLAEAMTKGIAVPVAEAPQVEKEKKSGPEMTPTGLARYFLELAGHKPTSKALADTEAGISEMLIEHDYKEIAFGIKWIFENSPEKPKTIKYIVNGMSRAMGAYEKQQARQKNEAEKVNQEKIEREKYDELAKKLDEYIAELEPEQYMEYAERATAELKEQGAKEEFITDMMILICVKSIIAREVFGDEGNEL